VLETSEEIDQIQRLLDASAAGAGPHLRNIITDEQRLTAPGLCARQSAPPTSRARNWP
jgi:hypothetical protein